MKDFYFAEQEDLAHFVSYACPNLMQKELTFISFDENFPLQDMLLALKQASKQTENLYVKIKEENFDKSPAFGIMKKLGLKNLCLIQELDFPKDNPISPLLYRDTEHIKKSHTGKSLEAIEKQLKAHNVNAIFEILLKEDSLELLFPTLKTLLIKDYPITLINPGLVDLNKNVLKVRDQLKMLSIYKEKSQANIYFTESHPRAKAWQLLSQNRFRGPSHVDIDVANTCTHDCVFCGLYSPEITKKHEKINDPKTKSEIKDLYKAKIDPDICLELVDGLADQVDLLTFGGMGDPFTHPDILSFLKRGRSRGFNVFCFSNYAYMSKKILEEIHELGSHDPRGLYFIVNLSAASAKTYVLNRPNQREETFEKVISSLKYTSELRKRDRSGANFVLMSVTNKLNISDMPGLIPLALDTGACGVWIKPIEIHGEETLEFLIPKDLQFEYAKKAQITLELGKRLGVSLNESEILEQVVKEHSTELSEYNSKTSLEEQIQAECEIWPNLKEYLSMDQEELKKHQYEYEDVKRNYSLPAHMKIEKKRIFPELVRGDNKNQISYTVDLKEHQLGVQNSPVVSDFYDKNPCMVGFNYLRIDVLGEVLPCCISMYPMGNINRQSYKEIWDSAAMEMFRDKLSRIHHEKFHRKDPDWYFCQQCSHMNINRQYSELLEDL